MECINECLQNQNNNIKIDVQHINNLLHDIEEKPLFKEKYNITILFYL